MAEIRFLVVLLGALALLGCPSPDDDDVSDDDVTADDDDTGDDDTTPGDDDTTVGDDDDSSDSVEWVGISCSSRNYTPYQATCCAVRSDGVVECWGEATAITSNPPAGDFTQVSLGSTHACVLGTDDEVTCWGEGQYGQAESPTGIQFKSVAAGGHHNCAILSDDTVFCWGSDAGGQATPPTGTLLSMADGGTSASCGVRSEGLAECWGQYTFTVGAGTYDAVEVSGTHACALIPAGLVECWADEGWNLPDPPMEALLAVDVAFLYSCGIRSDSTLTCWGDVEYEFDQMEPPSGSFSDVSIAGGHGCAISSTRDAIECWGNCDTGACDAP
jgi:hypothetical protein